MSVRTYTALYSKKGPAGNTVTRRPTDPAAGTCEPARIAPLSQPGTGPVMRIRTDAEISAAVRRNEQGKVLSV
jgi:hypothetical protein